MKVPRESCKFVFVDRERKVEMNYSTELLSWGMLRESTCRMILMMHSAFCLQVSRCYLSPGDGEVRWGRTTAGVSFHSPSPLTPLPGIFVADVHEIQTTVTQGKVKHMLNVYLSNAPTPMHASPPPPHTHQEAIVFSSLRVKIHLLRELR